MRPLIRLAAAAILAACSSSSSEVQAGDFAGELHLTADKASYSAAELAPGNDDIRGTLTTATDKPFYSNLGDAFNGATDQNPLYLAEGSDGVVERQSGDTWVKATSGILVEGVRQVVLTPSKTYTVVTTLSPPIQTGSYRLRIFLRGAPGGDRTGEVISPTFQIRQ